MSAALSLFRGRVDTPVRDFDVDFNLDVTYPTFIRRPVVASAAEPISSKPNAPINVKDDGQQCPPCKCCAIVFVVIVATKHAFSVSNKLIRAATGISVILFARTDDSLCLSQSY